jgi:hypothetical protein
LGNVLDVAYGFDQKLLKGLTKIQTNADGSAIQLAIKGSELETETVFCNASFTIIVGNIASTWDPLLLNGTGLEDLIPYGSYCTASQALELLHYALHFMQLETLVVFVDKQLTPDAVVPEFPLSLVTVEGLSVASLELIVDVPEKRTLFGFGNDTSKVGMVASFRSVGEFAVQLAAATGVPQSLLNVSYDPSTYDLRFRLKLDYDVPVIKDDFDLGFNLEPIAAASINGTIGINAHIGADVVVSANLQPPDTQLEIACKWMYPTEWPAEVVSRDEMFYTFKINNTFVHNDSVPFHHSMMNSSSGMNELGASLLSQLLPFGINVTVVNNVNSTSFRVGGFVFSALPHLDIDSIEIMPYDTIDPVAKALGCQDKMEKPKYSVYIEQARLTGTP